jgi:hypothetical protein
LCVGQNGEAVSLRHQQQAMIKQNSEDATAAGSTAKKNLAPTSAEQPAKKNFASTEKSAVLGGYASSSSVNDTKPTVSTKQQRLDSSVKAPVSKRRKVNPQQPRETDSATDEHSYLIEGVAFQEPTVEGVAFPPFFQESISTTSPIAETARLHAEIEELKRSVQALLASNKNLREEQ